MLRAQSSRRSPIVVGQSAVAASVTGTLTETTLASITIPGGMMGVNGVLRVIPLFSMTNNANTKTFNIRLGGILINTPVVASVAAIQMLSLIRNRNAQNSQVSFTPANTTGLGTAGAAVLAVNVDTSVDQVLALSGVLSNTGDTITLEGYTVEVLP